MNKRDPAFIVWCGLAVLGAAVLEGVAVWAVVKVMKVAGSMGLFAWFFPVVLVPGMLAAELARLRRTKSRRMWLLSLKYYTVYLPLVGVFVAACQFRGPGLVVQIAVAAVTLPLLVLVPFWFSMRAKLIQREEGGPDEGLRWVVVGKRTDKASHI